MARSFSKERILLSLPAMAVLFFALFSGVGLRLLGRPHLFPFARWDMFSVPPPISDYFLVEVSDAAGKFVCVLPGTCHRLCGKDRMAKVAYLVSQMGHFREADQWDDFRLAQKQFIGELVAAAELKFALKRRRVDLADTSAGPDNREGETIEEFGGKND